MNYIAKVRLFTIIPTCFYLYFFIFGFSAVDSTKEFLSALEILLRMIFIAFLLSSPTMIIFYSGDLIRKLIYAYNENNVELSNLMINLFLKKEKFINNLESGKVNLFEKE
ncbi:hypothetical protein [Flavobacterium sp. 3HN19-14]|uniref:hypothetical protein n=1 Tax=Flavobacterium sp. 3HN19-14 TaxID=3448133 RepID=UPI003EDE8963